MIEEITKKYFCRRCKKEISENQETEALKISWIPLCSTCEPEIKDKYNKWHKKFQEMKF